MVKLLEKAFAEVAKLSEEEQTAFAQWILAELESDVRWTKTFEATQNQLATLAQKALAEYQSGFTEELDLDTLE